MANQTKKPASNQGVNDGLLEQLRDIGTSTAKTVGHDLVSGVASDALSSLFGTPKSGDLQPNQPLNLQNPPPPAEDFPASDFADFPEFGLPWKKKEPERQHNPQVLQETINRLREHEAEVARKIDEIRFELKALIAAVKNVDKEIVKAVDEQMIEPGLYHITFLDRLKTMLKLMRQNLNHSSSWLSAAKSRRKQKGYWTQYKKKGTEWGLNNERTVATQVG